MPGRQLIMTFPVTATSHALPEYRARGGYGALAKALGQMKPQDVVKKITASGLQGRGGDPAGVLSGGEQQRVAIARAIVGEPALILADEPTGNLHSDQGREIMKLFKQLNAEGTTIIQDTHSAENATYGSRVIRLADGLLVN